MYGQMPGGPMPNVYYPTNQEDTTPITPFGYIGYMLLFSVPCVGLIFEFIWAFGQGNINRRNFARAYLIFQLITFVLVFMFYFFIFFMVGMSASTSGY